MTDCLIIGHNDMDFKKLVKFLQALGAESGDYKNGSLAYIEHNAAPMRALDIINYFTFGSGYQSNRNIYYNADFLQPAVAVMGSYLARHEKLEVDYINTFHREKTALHDKLIKGNILTIAIATTFYVSAEPIVEIIRFIKRVNKKAKIILGGPYVATLISGNTSSLSEIFHFLGADYYIDSSEGEKSLASLVRCIKSGEDVSRISNLYFRKDEGWQYTFKEAERNELHENTVMWDLFKTHLNQFASIRTAKSCPFSCAFADSRPDWENMFIMVWIFWKQNWTSFRREE